MSVVLLEFCEVDVFYGLIQVLKKVLLQVNEGEMVSLIGVNGVGKLMLLMLIFGQLCVVVGQIFYCGQDICQKLVYYVVFNGIVQLLEGCWVFFDMSVEENLLMGIIFIGMDYVEEDMQCMFELFLCLKEWCNQCVMIMFGGEQQMFVIVCVLMSWLKLLLFDEFFLGLVLIVVKQIFQILCELVRSGMIIFFVEQNVNYVLKFFDCVYVMVIGEICMSGSGEELFGNQEVCNVYFGGY